MDFERGSAGARLAQVVLCAALALVCTRASVAADQPGTEMPRFRGSFEHPTAITPGVVVPYSIDLHSASHVFKAGHHIAVQLQSTWFPLIDRNPQTFEPSIFKATRTEYKAQTHSVFHTPVYPSAIVLDMPSGHEARRQAQQP